MPHRYALRFLHDGAWRCAVYLNDRMKAVRYAASLYLNLGVPFDVYDCDDNYSYYSIGVTSEAETQ